MSIKRTWIDRQLAGTVATKHCNDCKQDAVMAYHQTYERDNGDVRDVYRCIADCPAKWKYESQNPDLKFVHPLFGFPHKL